MTVEPDFSGFMPQPTPPAPVVGPPPPPGEMLATLAEQQAMEQAAPQPVTPPAPALLGDTAGGRAGLAAVVGQQAVAGIDSGFDPLSAAQRFAAFDTKADPMGHARIAAAAGTYADNLANQGAVDPNGAAAAATLDLGKVKHLIDNDGVSDTPIGQELKQLWSKFQQSPSSLSDGEVSGLLDLVGQIGTVTEMLGTDDLTTDLGRVDKVDLLETGAVPRVRVVDTSTVAPVLHQVSGTLPELSSDGEFAVHLMPDGTSVAITAPASAGNVLRNLYPAIGDLWAQAKPRTVPDVQQVEQSLVDVPNAVHESWPAGAWDDVGGHPALSGDTVVTAIVKDGQLPRAFRQLGEVRIPNGAGVLTRPQRPDEAEPLPEGEEPILPPAVTERARRVAFVVPTDADPAATAAQVEILGGRDVAVYAAGDPPEGWQAARESFFTDPAGTLSVVRSANADRTAPHGVNVWVRPADLPKDLPATARTPEVVPAKAVAPGIFQFGDVMVNAPRASFAKADLLAATKPDTHLVGIGMTRIGGLPMLIPVFDGESESGFEAYGHVSGNEVVVQADPTDLAPVVKFGHVLGMAGVKPSRVRLEGSKVKRLFG